MSKPETVRHAVEERAAREPLFAPGALRIVLAKVAYGGIFVVALPLLLVAWAIRTEGIIGLPAVRSVSLGIALIALGLGLMGAGAWGLRVHGGGLPMNAFPPPRLVERGIYSVLPHPMYVGFISAVLGAALWAGSASGVWLVAPLTALGCVALVFGYERHDMIRRFGLPGARAALRLPPDEDARPAWTDRVSVYALVLLPWIVCYEAIARIGVPADAVATYLPGEARLPVLQSSELAYGSIYALTVLVPLIARSKRVLRRFAVRGLLAMALFFPMYLALPFVAPPRAFVPTTSLGHLLALERQLDTAACAFPSFHVAWAIFVTSALTSTWPRLRIAAIAWGAIVVTSCMTTGMHTIVDVVAGLAGAGLVMRARGVWEWLRRGSERIAGSWREWRVGRVRIINHGLYAAAGSVIALAIVGALAGRGSAAALSLAAVMGLVTSAIWAQIVEGSSQLLRPYGFYGGLLGIVLGCLFAPLLGVSTWTMLAAFCVAGPWVQSLGRLRCLVQGCCHGSPAPPHIGIRYVHPRSRVGRLAHLAGVPLHPTPLYSILWNVIVALAMARLWSVHAAMGLIAGLYLILTGLGRFVEESYRGEPQTVVLAGLRLYQWIAVASVATGILLTMFGSVEPAPVPEPAWPPLFAGLVIALVIGAGLGVDFPESDRRFSRLA
jgi:prolipoprotein diacylglyceryltransferase/protein-S-isoprenylcysteine O-methyltransferase Ste14